MAEHSKKEMSAYALIVALATGGGGFVGVQQAIEIADSHWVTYEALAEAELKGYLRELKREIRSLERDVQEGIATDRDKWELERLKEDLEDAESEKETETDT